MANPSATPPREGDPELRLTCVGRFPNTRVLAWEGTTLYASRGYELFRCQPEKTPITWEAAAKFSPEWWRSLTSASRIGSRLVRDGFHALAVLSTGELIAAVPRAIATLPPGEKEFRVTHTLQRGTRPLNLAVAPDGRVFWGEYFDNPARDEVHVYGSEDRGSSWHIVYSFERKAIRHIHNIVYDRWEDCFWMLNGDIGEECRIVRVSRDWSQAETILSGNQQARSVAAVPRQDGLYFASDTPLEQNYIYRLDRKGSLSRLSQIHASVLCGCAVGEAVFFTTMVEPSAINRDRSVAVYGSAEGASWARLQSWTKDYWSDRLFQYGNAFLPAGANPTNLLALTTVAVEDHDGEASLWKVEAGRVDAAKT